MVVPPLPPLVPPASVAQPLREKSSALPPRQLGSPPVVLAVVELVAELDVLAAGVLELPPSAPAPPVPPVVVEVAPPTPAVVAVAPLVSELPVVAPLVVADVVLAATSEEVPTDELASEAELAAEVE